MQYIFVPTSINTFMQRFLPYRFLMAVPLVMFLTLAAQGQEKNIRVKVVKDGKTFTDTVFVVTKEISSDSISALVSKLAGEDIHIHLAANSEMHRKQHADTAKQVNVWVFDEDDSKRGDKEEKMFVVKASGDSEDLLTWVSADTVILKGKPHAYFFTDDDSREGHIQGESHKFIITDTRDEGHGHDIDVVSEGEGKIVITREKGERIYVTQSGTSDENREGDDSRKVVEKQIKVIGQKGEKEIGTEIAKILEKELEQTGEDETVEVTVKIEKKNRVGNKVDAKHKKRKKQ